VHEDCTVARPWLRFAYLVPGRQGWQCCWWRPRAAATLLSLSLGVLGRGNAEADEAEEAALQPPLASLF
jgi:hypothetical protein